MTTNRIDHTACNHPKTPAGRRACRANLAAGGSAPVIDYIGDHIRKVAANAAMKARMDARCTINEAHCENCGSTDYDSINNGDQGYSACCNEGVSSGSFDCRNHHGWS